MRRSIRYRVFTGRSNRRPVGSRRLAEGRNMSTAAELLTNREYKYGFVTDIESDVIPKGLSEDTVRLISSKKNEPEWMLEFRLKAYRNWLKMDAPANWANFDYPAIDFQNISYYAAPREKAKKASMDEV